MSYDLEIWSAQEAAVPDALPSIERWIRQNGIWVHPGKGWQVVVDDPIGVDTEDVPEQIGNLIPGIAHLIRISMEPGDAAKTAHRTLMRSARSLAKASHGIIFDPQDDSVTLGAGVKRFAPPGREQQNQTLVLSWWFGPDVLAAKAGIQELVRLLRRYLPEALPRRYGTFEPPEHRLSETGESHLVEFLDTEGRTFMPVLFPHRPVTGFAIHLPDRFGQSQTWEGFRANTISIEILTAALSQPGWQRQIHTFWHQMSDFLQPFYGDVRHILGVRPHPVRAWFWRGFPSTSGVAAVIGQPYLELWPQAARVLKRGDGLAYFGSESWDDSTNIFDTVGGVPADLVNPNDDYWSIERYPPSWPFALPNEDS